MKRYILAIILLICTQLTAQNNKRPDSYYYNRGLECLNEGKNREAYDYFVNEISDNPDNGYAHTWLAYIFLNSDLFGDALSSLDKAEKNIPKKDKEFVAFAYSLRGEVFKALEEYNKALDYYTKAIKTYPEDTDLWENRAQLYYELKQYELSDKDFDKIIEIDPSGAIGYMGKGRNANMQNKFEDAIRLFDHVAKLHGKDYSSCYSFRAESYAGLKQYEKAADDIITALSIDGDSKAFYLLHSLLAHAAFSTMISKLKIQQLKEPNSYYWSYYSGVVYEENQNYEKAIENYKKSNEANVSGMTYNRIASCYSEIGDYLNAISNIEQAIYMEPENTIFKLNKSNYEYEANMIDKAFADIDACIADIPDYFYLHYRKGFFEDNLNMTDEAIEDYSTSILLNPDYFYAYLGRGDMYLKKGMTEEAMADYRQVVVKDTIPSDASCAQYAYLALGETDKAIEYNQRVLDSFPDDASKYYDAACLFARLGDTRKALDYLKTSFEKGFCRFAHLEKDDDLAAVRNTKEFKDMVAEYKGKNSYTNIVSPAIDQEDITVEIPFVKTGGVTEVQCTINGLPLHFVFDTGASDVTMSMVEATFMLKNKYLSPLDIIGKQNYLTADGNISEGTVINLKSVKFGDLELTNVRASVVKSQNAPLLLGQSVLGRLGKIEIDNEKRVIRVSHKSTTNYLDQATQVFQIVDEMPEFPGGINKLIEYLSQNIKYPKDAQEAGIQGKVHVNFIVEPDGSISNIKILQSVSKDCDEEAMRVVKAMPKWKPGKQDGKNVRVSFILPVNFKLADDTPKP